MTPREKAEDLVNKFYNYVFNPESHKDDNLKWTKECALIAVDEVIEQNNIWINQTGKGTNNYWKLVKEEINKL
jgi:hypothetical protein